ncbi:MAG: PBSX family phage terminase large subunit [Ruminococcaceae bacterium]|nr:PBSX family phage terminase large subunit [Oscillospiraceae bacterium]
MTSLEERFAQARENRRHSSVGFRFHPFSHRQKLLLGWWKPGASTADHDGVIADGAVRSGKTLAMSLGFVLWAMNSFDGENFAVCGKTLGSVERNILVWLRRMLPGRGYTVTEQRSRHLLTVSRGRRSNRFYCFGGKDEASQDLIQGMTLAGVLFDEAALMPESFVSQATARCSVPGSKWWFNCNPAGPYHWFKRGWLDAAEEKNLLHLHFTMADNLSLSDTIRRRYENMYTGVFYRRYILGEWCTAEGLVYPMFEPDCHVGEPSGEAERWFLSCDYGTHNPFALGLFSVRTTQCGTLYCLEKELYHDGRRNGQMTDSQYADSTERFVEGIPAEHIIVDPSASSFIAELRQRGFRVLKASNEVSEGIRCVADALTKGRLLIRPCCSGTLREFSSYIWDETAAGRGEDKPLKQNDHAMDMIRYALFTDRRVSSRTGRYSGKGTR